MFIDEQTDQDIKDVRDYILETYTGEDLGFGEVLHAMKYGFSVVRKGWNGKNMWVFVHDYGNAFPVSGKKMILHTATGENVPWVASGTDIMAEDWMLAE